MHQTCETVAAWYSCVECIDFEARRLGGGRLERLDLSRGVGGVLILPTPFRRRQRLDGVGCLIALDLSCNTNICKKISLACSMK